MTRADATHWTIKLAGEEESVIECNYWRNVEPSGEKRGARTFALPSDSRGSISWGSFLFHLGRQIIFGRRSRYVYQNDAR